MAGERTKVPAHDGPGRSSRRGVSRTSTRGSRKGSRKNAGGRISTGTGAGTGGRGKRRGESKVIPLPRVRRPGRSGVQGRPPTKKKKAVGHGRLRLIVGMVAIVCLSLGARAGQLSVTDDDRYQAFAAERRPGIAAEDAPPGRGSILSAAGQRLG